MNQWQWNPTEELNVFPVGQSLQQYTNSLADEYRQTRPGTWSHANTAEYCHQPAGMICNSVPTSSLDYCVGDLKPKDGVFPSSVHRLYNEKKINKSATRSMAQAQDHIIAERKRREKLSQRFIALSSIVPGLKKMDKASVLGDAIKYLKHLQERVRILEEQTMTKTVESVVFVTKSQLDDLPAKNEMGNETLPEIEVRFCEKSVLIRIHCEKRKGVLEKTMEAIERLPLTVINSNVMSFGTSAMDLTIIAQMGVDFNTTVNDVVKNLRTALDRFNAVATLS